MKDTFYLSDKRSKLKPFVRYEQPHEIKRNEKLSASIPKQEYPAADDAKPAAVGKLFSEQIWMCLSLCSDSLPFLKCSSWDSFLTRKHQSLLKYTKFFFLNEHQTTKSKSNYYYGNENTKEIDTNIHWYPLKCQKKCVTKFWSCMWLVELVKQCFLQQFPSKTNSEYLSQ